MYKQTLSKLALAVILAAGTYTAPVALLDGKAYAQEQQEQKTRRVPTLRGKVYEQLARAQALADEDKVSEAIAVLDEVKSKDHSMNSYELAMMYNFYGFIHYNAEQYDKAIQAFEDVVKQQPIPEAFEMSTLFSLAQLHMMQGNYDKTLAFLERWEKLNQGDIPAKNYLLKAQAMYQNKDYTRALGFINEAIALVEKEDKVPEENWFILQRAIYYELKQPEKVKDVLAKLIKHYNDGKYWVQLGGMYGELGQEKKQLAILESAYQQGYITSGSDVFNLAQLYYYHQVPVKGARLMEQAMKEGVLERNLRNLKFLASCWSLAKENDKAVPVMIAAAEMSEDGELDAQLGQMYLNMEKYDQAIAASQKALEKGQLRNPGLSHLVLGMAYFNKKRFNDALNELAKAEKFDAAKRMAQQWSKYVETEKVSHERLQAELSS
ncbi:tetratricopeptide repeat protein [Aliiglaciecola sp. CAU 1673]|uniref:tetratricopeptide repeat protein n=1 Tax=Aliiglaciecola sp. CAU 1673 TaxID=3032595 RepID=UPI0023DB6BA3|nr:tetratricopeptide repeat protein [Aliiglaciecola sp. CAU 1673]MDF2176947.1 tetratricopeptide repeat protein [Aliiglaciecola sp. CAU 1673]